MRNYFLPIILAVGGGILYHVAQKTVPKDANPIFALIIAYLSSLLVVTVCFFIFNPHQPILPELKNLHWAMVGIGIGAAAIEIGFLFAYRAGWRINSTNLYVNIAITLILIPIGLLWFRESLSRWNVTGIILCILGLILLSKR
ncbi:MAG: EamA family transporter [Acidobacteriota bacterium]